MLWSGTFALARSLSEQVGAIAAGAAVYLLGGAVLWILRLARGSFSAEKKIPISRKYLLGCGSLFVLYTVLLYLAVGWARNRQQLLEVALLNYLWPALTIIFSLLLLNKRAGIWLWPGTVMALAGVVIALTQGAGISVRSCLENVQTNPPAYLLALGAAFAWAIYSNLTRKWSDPDQGGGVDVFIPVTGIMLLLMHFIFPSEGSWSFRAMGESAILGGITALAYLLWEVAMRKGNLLLVAASAYFTPLLSTLVSCLYLRITPGPELWLGCALVTAGSLLSWRWVFDKKQ